MKLAVGLGNPGSRYLATRHNVGFRVVEALAKASGIDRLEQRFAGRFGCGPSRTLAGPPPALEPDRAVLLPQTFMNRSGESVAAAIAELPVDLESDFAVVTDDLDLPFGQLRIRPGGGAGGHRGLESLIEHLDTRAFARLRFGIGRPETGEDPVEYVLAPFSAAEELQLGERIDDAVAALETLFREGVSAAMNLFNRPLETSPPIAPEDGPREA